MTDRSTRDAFDPRSPHGQRTSRVLAAGMLVALLGSGCAGLIHVRPADPVDTYRRNLSAEVDSRGLSEGTRALLARHDLTAQSATEPEALIAALDRFPATDRAARFAAIELALVAAARVSPHEPEIALAGYVDAAARAWDYLFAPAADGLDTGFAPDFEAAIAAYDFAVARIVERVWALGLGRSRPSTIALPVTVSHPGRRLTLDLTPYRFSDFDAMTPTDRVDVRGFPHRHVRYGIGTPLVDILSRRAKLPGTAYFPPRGLALPLTAVVRFDDAGETDASEDAELQTATLELLDPTTRETATFAGYTAPVAADFTASFGYLAALGEQEIRRLGKRGMFSPESTDSFHGIFTMEPYDPDKIPVVMIHGLWSDPSIWLPMTNELVGDAEIRRAYQIWYFMYPSGEPFLWTAAMLRDSLAAIRHNLDPEGSSRAMQSIVLIGHSMGGLLAKRLATDSGDILWDEVFTVPPDRLDAPESDVERLRQALEFEPQPYAHRIVFLSTPQRGAGKARGLFGRLTSSKIHPPTDLDRLLQGIAERSPDAIRPRMLHLFERGAPTSLRALWPNNPVMHAFSELPIAAGVPYHVIVGDRGQDGGPNATDGVVPYSSSHLDGAASELIVPTGHHTHSDPQAIREVVRILKENMPG